MWLSRVELLEKLYVRINKKNKNSYFNYQNKNFISRSFLINILMLGPHHHFFFLNPINSILYFVNKNITKDTAKPIPLKGNIIWSSLVIKQNSFDLLNDACGNTRLVGMCCSKQKSYT